MCCSLNAVFLLGIVALHYFVNKPTCKMNFLGLQLHDKVAVLAFRGICMTKKKSSVPSGKNAFDVRGAQCVFEPCEADV